MRRQGRVAAAPLISKGERRGMHVDLLFMILVTSGHSPESISARHLLPGELLRLPILAIVSGEPLITSSFLEVVLPLYGYFVEYTTSFKHYFFFNPSSDGHVL